MTSKNHRHDRQGCSTDVLMSMKMLEAIVQVFFKWGCLRYLSVVNISAMGDTAQLDPLLRDPVGVQALKQGYTSLQKGLFDKQRNK